MNLSKTEKFEIFENAISWIVVFAMFVYGAGKIMQFDGATAINKTISELTGMELMWAFYGYSKAFALTLGFLEITGGVLILIKKTRIIGCLFISTILINIILQDIFYEVNIGALIAAIIYQVLILIILWLNRERLIHSINSLIIPTPKRSSTRQWFVKLFIAFILFIILRVIEYFLTH